MKAKNRNCFPAILMVWLLSLAMVPLCAQNHISRHYTVNDGLPSMVVYDILQDDQGFIWFATKEGLSRYNGYTFQNFSTDDGLPDNEVIAIRKGKDGLIWIMPFRNKLAFIRNDSIQYANLPFEENDPVKNIETNLNGELYITLNSGKLIDYTGNRVNKIYKDRDYFQTDFTMFHGLSDKYGNMWLSCDTLLLKVDTNNCIRRWLLKDDLNFVGTMRVPMITPSQEIYLFTNLLVAKLIDDTLTPIFSNKTIGRDLRIINITPCENGILVATSQGAYRVLNAADGIISYEGFFVDQTISKALEDREGNLWFCTTSNGVYKISTSSKHVKNIGPTNGLFESTPSSLFLFNDTVAVSSLYGDVYTLAHHNQEWAAQKRAFGFFLERLNNCNPFNGETWCTTNFGITIYQKGETLSKTQWKSHHYVIQEMDSVYLLSKELDMYNIGAYKDVVVLGNKMWLAGSNTLNEFDLNPTGSHYLVKRLYNKRVTALAFDNEKQLWVASNTGLYRQMTDSVVYSPSIAPNINITDLLPFGNKGMWVATSGRGLYRLDSITDVSPKRFIVKDGLPSNVVNHVMQLSNGLVLSTDKGLAMLVPAKENQYTLYPLSINDGLSAPEVLQTLVYKGHLFALTSKGVSIIKEEILRPDSSAPLVYITNVNISGQDTLVVPSYTLPYDKNSIRLEYVGLSYKSNGNLLYRYQMEGIDTGWVQTSFTNTQYPTLPPGKYTFKVDSRSLQGPWSNKPATMQITILPPFWKTWWFRLALVLVGGGIVTGISYAVIRYYRKQSQIAQRMVELEGQALRANMNPHFVFNALNAIHDFIANQDERSAHLYLGKFAQLIRSILDQSRKNFISLDEELDTLKLYLELENMRFEHKFEYRIEMGEGIQPYDIELPPMLIQPYLENAIRHGLLNMGKPGVIGVRFSLADDYLKCTITDNGVGRAKSALASSERLKSHRSVGMEITKKRIELIHSGNKNGEVTITDLYDTNGQATGTQVDLRLPIKEH